MGEEKKSQQISCEGFIPPAHIEPPSNGAFMSCDLQETYSTFMFCLPSNLLRKGCQYDMFFFLKTRPTLPQYPPSSQSDFIPKRKLRILCIFYTSRDHNITLDKSPGPLWLFCYSTFFSHTEGERIKKKMHVGLVMLASYVGFLLVIGTGMLLAEYSGSRLALWVPIAVFVKNDRAPWPCL